MKIRRRLFIKRFRSRCLRRFSSVAAACCCCRYAPPSFSRISLPSPSSRCSTLCNAHTPPWRNRLLAGFPALHVVFFIVHTYNMYNVCMHCYISCEFVFPSKYSPRGCIIGITYGHTRLLFVSRRREKRAIYDGREARYITLYVLYHVPTPRGAYRPYLRFLLASNPSENAQRRF